MQDEKRAIKRDKYAIALVISILTFSLGFLLGTVLDSYKYEYVAEIAKQQELEFNSLQLQYIYLESIQGTEKCPALYQTLENNLRTLEPTVNKMLDYEKSKGSNSSEYLYFKRQYFLANIKYWMLSEDIQKTCNSDTVTVLYFFNNNCDICFKSQGVILSNLKQLFEDKLLVFAIDSDFTDEPMIGLLKNKYNITVYPTLVINNEKIEQFLSRDDLLMKICPKYINRENITACKGYY